MGRRAAEVELLTARELDDFFSRAQDERRFWLTKYESADGPVFAGGFRLHTDKFARAEFVTHRHSTVPGIEIKLRSPQTYLALLDTSSRASWIEFDLAREQGLIPVGPPPYRLFATHVDDPIPGYLVVASRLVIDTLHVDAALLYAKGARGPLTLLNRSDPALRAPVILGSDFIRAFRFVRFNLAQREVIFSTTGSYQPDPDRLIASVPLQDFNGIIAVEGMIDQMTTPFLLDMLGDYHIAANVAGMDMVRQVIAGDLVLRNVPLTDVQTLNLGLPDVPRIGRRILERFVVTFDNGNRMIHFERP